MNFTAITHNTNKETTKTRIKKNTERDGQSAGWIKRDGWVQLKRTWAYTPVNYAELGHTFGTV